MTLPWGARVWYRPAAMRWVLGLLVCIGCASEIEHGLDERAANEVVLALNRAGVGARKEREAGEGQRWSVQVPSAEAGRAMEVLKAHELPRGPGSAFRDLYGKQSLVPSPNEDRARWIDALGGELARTLETADGVITARVHLALPDADPLAPHAERTKPSASVLLKRARGIALGISEADVKRLVAGAVSGLSTESVSVVSVESAAQGEAPALAHVGPIAVAAASRGTLTAILASCVGVILLLGVVLVVTSLRQVRANR